MARIPFLILISLGVLGCSRDDGNIEKNGDNSVDTIVPDTNVNEALGFLPCENGLAGSYPCNGYNLLGGMSLQGFEATSGNDIWGWTDTSTGKEYALVGLDNGTAFVDITDTE